MSTVAIVGGNGQIARLLHPLLVARGHTPVALVRSESHRNRLEALGAAVRLLDIEKATAHDFAAAFEDSHAVVFAAGGGPDGNIERKRTVDLEGSLKSIQGARLAGISRFVQVSAINVDEPVPGDAGPVWRAYVEAKRDADKALRASGLDWTIIRPGLLTDDDGTGLVELGEDVQRAEVPRADVAAVLAEVLDTGAGIGTQWNLVAGDVPVAEAVAGTSAR
ncbi:SDR family oxidoreductase [Nocardioides piscis]|uniref:SDR family oxidoreductase n=1 Tax=Nocardioides piscis TaxID=2714938 RepID=A0A6G7YJW6_9ACTN|nr:SDR family oxidoreductase [Nocardioides piscis]QIK77043.1 SDR family oxidoreductase [Nocardioides piscis]